MNKRNVIQFILFVVIFVSLFFIYRFSVESFIGVDTFLNIISLFIVFIIFPVVALVLSKILTNYMTSD